MTNHGIQKWKENVVFFLFPVMQIQAALAKTSKFDIGLRRCSGLGMLWFDSAHHKS
jgi:hypothetical protein